MASLTKNLMAMLGLYSSGDIGPFTCYTKPGKRLVYFLRSPPKVTRSKWQLANIARWKTLARLWRSLSQDERTAWTNAANQANLGITGYNLFLHTHSKANSNTARTIQTRTGIVLHLAPGLKL